MSATAVSATARSDDRARFDPRVLFAFALPLFFVLMMSATLVTALHAPKPHDLALTIAGPSASAGRVAAGLERDDPSRFDVTTSDAGAAEVRRAVLRRETVGAVVIGGSATAPTVTTYIASGGGRSAASAVQAVGTGVAQQLRTTARVVDLAPLTAQDSLGTGVFYLIVFASIGGYLTLIVLTQVVPGARLRTRYGVSLAAGVLAPVVVFGLASIFLQGFGASFGQIAAILGVLVLYVVTVALVVVLAEQLIGRSAIFLVAPIAIFLNIASAGGAVPESLLPGFWQALHSFWFGAGANEALRDIVYFPGASPLRWIVQLLVWTIGLLVLTLLVEGTKLIWRLQSIVLAQHRRSASVRDHLLLMSVPKQPAARHAITDGRGVNEEPAPDGVAPAREQEPVRTAG